uniref:Regulatory subunit of type II PKA R-subunit (RIIa) domain containing 1 n=1 Tax=Iconisemion striatum TaxID=60296 RepID=A0A1A7YNE2_9TELE
MEEKGVSNKPNFGELSAEQKEKLRQFKIKTRLDNERYLRAHPELGEMIGEFINKLMLNRPTNIQEFAADHFTSLDTRAAPSTERSSTAE